MYVEQKSQETNFHVVNVLLEVDIDLQSLYAVIQLGADYLGDSIARRAGIVRMTSVDTKTSSVSGQFFDVEHAKASRQEYLEYRVKRKVGKVFVIDGIELALLEQSQKMREFQGDGAVFRKQAFEAQREIIDCRHVGIHVVSDDQIGTTARCSNWSPSFSPK